MKGILTIAICLSVITLGFSQAMVLDKVVAKVGNEYVLLSEVEERHALAAEKGAVEAVSRCQILEDLLVTNLLVHHARIDSNEVTPEELEAQLDQRIAQIMQMMGGDVSQFESYYDMTIAQAKEMHRIDLRKKLNSQRVQGTIMQGIKVTPSEVITYFESIPEDSLPFFNSEVEIAEIVYKPEINALERAKAMEKINEIQKKLDDGENFEELAKQYSDDRGSAQQGGSLGRNSRGTFVTEFEAAAYKMSVGEITDPVESQFGFHIIRIDGRWGNAIEVSHILIRPQITLADLDTAKTYLMSIRSKILADSLTFVDAVRRYSDKTVQSYSNSGRVTNPKTGNTFFETADLDHQIFFALDTVGMMGITGPVEFKLPTGDVMYKLVQLQSRTPPHRASLQRDYSKIQNAAKQSKQNEAFEEWIAGKIGETFILVDANYNGCENLQRWNVQSIEP